MSMSSAPPRRLLAVLVALLVLVPLVGACGSKTTTSSSSPGATTVAETGASPGTCPTSNTTDFAKTKFVSHAALAFGAFHRYLYKPFRAGTFASGHHGRILALIKGAAAAVFIEHEVRLAAQDVEANPTLCRAIAAPMRGFYNDVSGLGSTIKGGGTTALPSAETSLDSVISAAGGQHVSIVPDDNASIG
jgi:hypothetical protein